LVVLLSPCLDNASGFFQGVEQIAIDIFLSKLSDETFDIRALPWTVRRDVDRLAILPGQPILHFVGKQFKADELRQQGQVLLDEQKPKIESDIESGKK